jgi:acyl carrier protein
MMTKPELHAKLVDVLHEAFDIPVERITPTTKLYEELDIDSIDAVDLIVRMKPLVGNRRMQPDVFKSVRTVQDVVDALFNLMAEAPVAQPAPAPPAPPKAS